MGIMVVIDGWSLQDKREPAACLLDRNCGGCADDGVFAGPWLETSW
jgi:hypothetical protein